MKIFGYKGELHKKALLWQRLSFGGKISVASIYTLIGFFVMVSLSQFGLSDFWFSLKAVIFIVLYYWLFDKLTSYNPKPELNAKQKSIVSAISYIVENDSNSYWGPERGFSEGELSDLSEKIKDTLL